jgi:lipid II:glycine glycyltransferase (peptidoglycan interpeptide bridge formation enzyme)
MKSRGSYLLHWKLLEVLKQQRIAVYNLNGINPVRNPGTYKFKNDLAGSHGQDVHFHGRFDSHESFVSYLFVHGGDRARKLLKTLKKATNTARGAKMLAGSHQLKESGR